MSSALDPHGPVAEAIATLAFILFGGGTIVFLTVMALSLVAFRGGDAARHAIGRRGIILAGGVAAPVAVLSALLVYDLALTPKMLLANEPAPLRIEVVGERWWWRVNYAGEGGAVIPTANEIHVPVGRTVELELATADLIHSFWVPSLAGKLDMIPGRVNRLRLRADREGVYRGQCAEYCGAAHAQMAFEVVAVPAPAFDAWLVRQREAARPPASAALERGRALFFESGCGACHAIRGSEAAGTIGPDLTHVGARRRIAGGTLPMNAGTLAAFVADSEHLKPGTLMPPMTSLSGAELRLLGEFLASLE